MEQLTHTLHNVLLKHICVPSSWGHLCNNMIPLSISNTLSLVSWSSYINKIKDSNPIKHNQYMYCTNSELHTKIKHSFNANRSYIGITTMWQCDNWYHLHTHIYYKTIWKHNLHLCWSNKLWSRSDKDFLFERGKQMERWQIFSLRTYPSKLTFIN